MVLKPHAHGLTPQALAAPPHPGRLLRWVLDRYAIPQGELAKALGVQATNLSKVIHEQRPVTVNLARRLAMALGTRPEFWLERQLAWDLAHAEELPSVTLVQGLAHLSQARPKFWLERELALEFGQVAGTASALPAERADGARPRNGHCLRREADRVARRLSAPRPQPARRPPRLEARG